MKKKNKLGKIEDIRMAKGLIQQCMCSASAAKEEMKFIAAHGAQVTR